MSRHECIEQVTSNLKLIDTRETRRHDKITRLCNSGTGVRTEQRNAVQVGGMERKTNDGRN